MTCHIEGSLRAKIEKGEYIDLEKLLPKDCIGGGGNISTDEESKVELVSQGGHTYFRPIRDNQIIGLRCWEQAFRVYAAVYTRLIQRDLERYGNICIP